jgi:RNA polymerase sigma-70 factor (ECF subfamily)
MKDGTALSDKHELFTALRPSLFAVAYHMLGNAADAEDMVQEAFLRWQKTDESQVGAPKAFLTTVVTRLCLQHLQSPRVQREGHFGSAVRESLEAASADAPDAHAQLADALAEALIVLLQSLSPVERAVFLLRDVFDCEYSEIAGAVDKSEENCRQILRRAREGVATRRPRYQVVPQQEERIVRHFLRAAADGNWAGLVEVLSDDATLVRDGADVGQGPLSVQGVRAVAELILRQASRWFGEGASFQALLFQTRPGILAFRNGLPVCAIFLSARDGAIRDVRVITCPLRLRSLLVVSDH